MYSAESPATASAPSELVVDPAIDRQQLIQRRYALATVGIPTLGFVAAVIDGCVSGVSAAELVIFLVMYSATAVGIEAGFHRYFSHHAFRGSRAVTYLLGTLGSMAGQGPVLFWAAIHRRHHAAADRPGDPHSPRLHGGRIGERLRGLWHAHLGWLFRVDRTDWARIVPDLLRDRDIVEVNARYPQLLTLGLAIPAAIGYLALGPSGLWRGFLWGGLVRIFLLDHVTWAVNSFGHLWGRHPYVSKDHSGNIAILAVPSFGGSWHNNHHAFPSSARNDHRLYQVDFSGLFIEGLGKLGMAWDINRPARLSRRVQRKSIKEEA
jgi:stearoyl-CoA desaturase (delta-9 desaturase)